MKRFRIFTALLFALSLPGAFTPARAVEVTEGDVATPDTIEPTAPQSKAGVLAAMGCGMAIASFAILPNPVSGFIMGFDCMFMLIDAWETPDR